MKAIAIGDLHLTQHQEKGGLAAYLPDHDQMVKRQVFKVLDYALLHSIRHIFLLGDTCCGPRMSYPAQLALQEILARPGFVFHIILGNHDLKSEDPNLGHSLEVIRPSKTIRIYTEPTLVTIEDAPVRFLPYPHSSFTSKALNIAHLDIKNAKTDSGRVQDSEELPTTKAVCVIGHLHTNQRVRNCYFPGTIYQTNFGEQKEKYFALIDFESPEDYEITNIPIESEYVLHRIKIKCKADLKKIPKSKYDLVKLVIDKDADIDPDDYSEISSVKIIPETQSFLGLDEVEGDAVEFSIDEFFCAWLDAQSMDNEKKEQITKFRASLLKGRS